MLVICAPIGAQADWYSFTPCGYSEDVLDPLYAQEDKEKLVPKFVPAPNLKVIYWWIPENASVQVVQTESVKGRLVCSWLRVNNDQWLVKGSADTLRDYIVKNKVRRYQHFD